MSEINISFSIHYECIYGEAIYITGNIPELGEWDVSKSFKLKWSPGDIWTGELKIPKNCDSLIYKYFVSDWYMHPFAQVKRWEISQNRMLSFNNSTCISIEDVWNINELSIFKIVSGKSNNPKDIFPPIEDFEVTDGFSKK